MEIILKKYIGINNIDSMNQNWVSFNAKTTIKYEEGDDFFLHIDQNNYPFIRTMPRRFIEHDNKTPEENCKIFINKLIELNK